MIQEQNKTARFIAAETLNQFRPKCDYAGTILNKLLSRTDQKQQATDLVFGSIRNRCAIDKVIDEFSGCRIERIQGKLLNIIRIACYELIYCPVTEQYAIVNEAVENAHVLTGKKQVGFVNALVRKITRSIKNRRMPLPQVTCSHILATTIDSGCEFERDFLPDPLKQPIAYLSTVYSLPDWLVSRWLAEFGLEKTRQICLASNRRPSIYVRPNSLKISVSDLVSQFQTHGISCELVSGQKVIKINSPQQISQIPGFEDGLFVVQDVTASGVVESLNPKPGWKILDFCAAPGTKTTQLAEATKDRAEVYATDIDAERLHKVGENAERLDIDSIKIIPYEKFIHARMTDFDCISLDVPCSNTGVLAKRIEVRYRLEPQAVMNLAGIQAELLLQAASFLKPQGRICYSTCSILKEENDKIVRDFLQKKPSFRLESEQLILPGIKPLDCDGGYIAVLVSQ